MGPRKLGCPSNAVFFGGCQVALPRLTQVAQYRSRLILVRCPKQQEPSCPASPGRFSTPPVALQVKQLRSPPR
jgi:hypothetical protein